MKEHLITGSIVTYNNSKIIKKCIESVLKYTQGTDFCLYVYDNCSEDNTAEIIERLFPEVVLIRGKENKGFGYGHNQIIKKIHSKYHVLINPDIIIDTPVIKDMAVYMEKHCRISILLPKVLNIDGSEQYLPKRQPNFKFVIMSKFPAFKYFRSLYTGENQKICRPVKCQNISGSFFMIQTEMMKALGGFDERYFMYFEDADLARRVTEKEGCIVYAPDFYVYHEWKRDNTKNIKGIRIFLQSMFKYIKKWKCF